jgi:hypothetical protein
LYRPRFFRHVADVRNILHGIERLAVEKHFAFIGIKNAGNHADEGGFAGPFGPSNPKMLPSSMENEMSSTAFCVA